MPSRLSKSVAYLAIFCASVGLTVLALSARANSPTNNAGAMTTTSSDSAAPVFSKSGHDITPLSQDRIDELAKDLSPEDAAIILKKGTEPAFCGNLLDNKKEGVYTCKLCGLPLFSSEHKFDSGSGWPSFFRPYDTDHIRYDEDTSYGMRRIEIMCNRCGGHLGHVFEDGPKPTGLRYCLNSASLEFTEKGTEMPDASKPVQTETAYFAGGCFWGIEDRLQQVPGVIDAVSGYMGGRVDNPTYKQVCYTDTGHAETVRLTYDPAKVSYDELLGWFFKIHNPTQLNRQGPDIGTQYRSAIFAADEKQLKEAERFIAEQQASNPRFKDKKIVTQVVLGGGTFWEAEEYHQDYHLKHGGSCPLPTE